MLVSMKSNHQSILNLNFSPLIINKLFFLREEGLSNIVLYIIIGGVSLIVIIGAILFLVMRKREYKIDIENNRDNAKEGENDNNNPQNKNNYLEYGDMKNANNFDKKDNEKKEIEDENEIKVVKKLFLIQTESINLSVDKSSSNLMPLSISEKGSINTKSESLGLSRKNNESEIKNSQEDNTPIQASEQSKISNLSAHKIVIRNNKKDLVCFTNERRSEPAGDLFNELNNRNIIEFNDNGNGSEKESISISSCDSDSIKDKTEKAVPIFKTMSVLEIKKEIGDNMLVSKKFDIKQNRIITDFDENTKDVMNFAVFKQNDLISDTKIEIKDYTNQEKKEEKLGKPNILNHLEKKQTLKKKKKVS